MISLIIVRIPMVPIAQLVKQQGFQAQSRVPNLSFHMFLLHHYDIELWGLFSTIFKNIYTVGLFSLFCAINADFCRYCKRLSFMSVL